MKLCVVANNALEWKGTVTQLGWNDELYTSGIEPLSLISGLGWDLMWMDYKTNLWWMSWW